MFKSYLNVLLLHLMLTSLSLSIIALHHSLLYAFWASLIRLKKTSQEGYLSTCMGLCLPLAVHPPWKWVVYGVLVWGQTKQVLVCKLVYWSFQSLIAQSTRRGNLVQIWIVVLINLVSCYPFFWREIMRLVHACWSQEGLKLPLEIAACIPRINYHAYIMKMELTSTTSVWHWNPWDQPSFSLTAWEENFSKSLTAKAHDLLCHLDMSHCR